MPHTMSPIVVVLLGVVIMGIIIVIGITAISDETPTSCDDLCDKAFSAAALIAIDQGTLFVYKSDTFLRPEALVLIEGLEQRITRYQYHLSKAVERAQARECSCVPPLDDMELWSK